MNEEKAKIYNLLVRYRVLFKEPPTDETMQAYTNTLEKENISFSDIRYALDRLAIEKTFYPAVAIIIQKINPSEETADKAYEWVGEIFKAAAKHGRYNQEKAREALGELKWRALDTIGGYFVICNASLNDGDTLRSHLRDACKGVIRKEKVILERLGYEQRKTLVYRRKR